MPTHEADPSPTPLAGRRIELATLQTALTRARDERRAQVSEVIGEPGMGKSRLLAEIALRARDEGWLVAYGQPAEFRPGLPLASLVDALDDHLNGVDLTPLEQAQPGSVALLAAVFPALALKVPGAEPVEEYRLLRAIRALLCLLSEASGLMLVLDDLHRCDALTVTVIDYLLRHPPAAPLMLAVAYRPGRVSPRLVRPFTAAAQRDVAHRIVLPPLTPEEAQALLDPRMLRWQRDLTYRRSRGNPAYLEVLTAAARHGRRADGLPPLVAAPLLADFEALSQTGRLVAHAAAVIGEGFDPQLLAEVAEVDHADALRGIDDMLQNDLICPIGTAQQFEFRHPLVRQVAYQQASGGWRLGAHGRAATALSRRRAPIVALARHVERAAAPGDVASTRVLTDAARSVLSTRPAQAADWLSAALRLLGHHPETRERRLEILDLLSVALVSSGRLAQARQTLTELLAVPDAPDRMSAALRAAEVDLLLGRVHGARRRLRSELLTVDDPGPAATRLRLRLCTVALFDELPDLALAEQVAASALPATTTATIRATAAATLAATRLACGGPNPDQPADLAAELIDQATDEELSAELWGLIWLSTAEVELERYDRSREHAARGLTIAQATGQLQLIPYLLAVGAESHLGQGQLAAAGDLAGQLELTLGSVGQPAALRLTHLILQSRIAAAAGDPSASPVAYRAAELAGRMGGRPARLARVNLGRTLLNEGRAEHAASTMLEGGDGTDMSTLRPPERLDLLADMTRAELARGNPQAAARWCEQVQRLARPDQPGHIGIAELAAARLALRDDPATAAQRARYAAELALKAGRRLDSGHALLLAAAALAAIGDDRAAEEVHAEASAMLAECGAGRLAVVLDEENRLVRGDPRESSALSTPDTVPEFIALSEREMQIAELVSHGHTNRQIARLLSLSHKTVETYLARIFSKLGVSSRSSVATLVGCGALGEHSSAETCIGRNCATPAAS